MAVCTTVTSQERYGVSNQLDCLFNKPRIDIPLLNNYHEAIYWIFCKHLFDQSATDFTVRIHRRRFDFVSVFNYFDQSDILFTSTQYTRRYLPD